MEVEAHLYWECRLKNKCCLRSAQINLPLYASEQCALPNESFLFAAWNFPVEFCHVSFPNLLAATEAAAHSDP